MDITDILETLAIEHLGQVKLDDLATKIEQATPEKINRSQALKVIMGWLHEQIKRDNIMQNGSLRDFVNLLRDSGTCPFTKEEVIQDFEKWQMKDAAEDPTNRRQYSIAKSELQLLFDQVPIYLQALRSTRGTSHKENALIREDATDYNPSDRKTFFIRTGGGHGNNKAKRIDSVGMRADEGRLSYDDDIFIDSQQFLQTPKTKKTHKPDTDDQVSEEGEFVKVARSEPVLIPEEAEQAKRDTDRLLGELEAEILATLPSIKGTAPCGPSGVAMLDTHHNDAGHMDIDEGTCQSDADTGPAEVDLALIESPDGTRYRLVTETQFSPEIVALFRNRENPILNSKDNRKTASQM
ncbi:hypothetical protein UCREL1_11053 [Eutypa lata UCREL1]|uniref:Uncharacterized protein n=1 Tax=Eutypa lata (strain UCR-EL1) TaxID=1287681 RepID=M7SCV0_EUTLA|nr:hypothetical protein UCREL1_11053 [Eutypa lata UCREL1]